MSLQGIKLITFDATNTLLRFKVPPWEYYTTIGRKYGFRGTPTEVKSCFRESFKVLNAKYPNFGRHDILWENWWREVVKRTFYGKLPTEVDVNLIAEKLIDDFRTTRCWNVAAGGERLLGLVRGHGAIVGVISNSDPRLYDILQNISLSNRFDFIITSYDIGYSKPDKRIFESALCNCKLPIKPSECLHIGDDLINDYEGAKAAGWHALLVGSNKSNQTPPALKHVFTNLEDLCLKIEEQKLQL